MEADSRLDFEVEHFDHIVDFLRDSLAGDQRSSCRTIYVSHVVILIQIFDVLSPSLLSKDSFKLLGAFARLILCYRLRCRRSDW